MNRPKFRVWDKVSETMHKVEGIRFGINGARVISLAETNRYNNNHKRWHTDIELLQSTGLFDKNGKEIFEGDIVKHDPVPNQFISNGYFEIIQARSGEWRMDNYRGGQVLAYSNHEVEVVGNKFENPELLEED